VAVLLHALAVEPLSSGEHRVAALHATDSFEGPTPCLVRAQVYR
jgi:hypothetical protein